MSETGRFNENTRVQVPAALHLCRLGYTYLDHIDDNDYDHSTNILTDVFKSSLKRLNPKITDTEIDVQLDALIHAVHNDDLGKEFYEKITSTSGIRFIDFENHRNNTWHCTTEFACENPETHDNFRPDITCFINGLPLAFIELKIPNNREGMLKERDRMNVRMRNKANRAFLNVTQLFIFSNNQEYDECNGGVPIQGAFYATISKDRIFFNVFREEKIGLLREAEYNDRDDEETEKSILIHRNCIPIKEDVEYKTNKSPSTPTNKLLTSMLSKRRFLFILRYAFAYVDRTIENENGEKLLRHEKHIMRYQQLFATFALREKLSEGIKGGLIWHTQGSGKTALAFFSVKSLTDYYATRGKNIKFFFIVDRLDLLEQASAEFEARGLFVQIAQTRAKLLEMVNDTVPKYNPEGKPEIIVVNIQRFAEDKQKVEITGGYSIQLQRIFFVDEAHRGYNPKGTFLANLLEADHDAIKIAMTGTPLLKDERETWRVFGDYIHTYYYDRSIADGYTLKLMREDIETSYREQLSGILQKLTNEIEIKKRDFCREKIIENPNYLNALLDYILNDFRRFRIQQASNVVAGMIVCETNDQARALEKAFIEHNTAANLPPNTKPLRALLVLHDEGDKQTRKISIAEFKTKESIDFLIVNKMLLTGFDAPRLKRLYLLRKLDGHDLLQALTRVNRPYRNFRFGYVVDFADIKENFEQTNNRYLQELNKVQFGSEEDGANNVPPILVSRAEVVEALTALNDLLFPYDTENKEEFRKQLDEIHDKDKLLALRNALETAKAMANQVRAFGSDELKKKIAADAPAALPVLLAEVNHRIDRLNLFENVNHSTDVAGLINEILDQIEFSFRCIGKEELNFFKNDLVEKMQKVGHEFAANLDPKEDKYINLYDEFRTFCRKRGFECKNVTEVKEAIGYLDSVMAKIREINRRNNVLRKKYHEDEKFMRIHKRIIEENTRRAIPPEKPIISKHETEICESLSRVKKLVDETLYKDVHVLENEPHFNQSVLSEISLKLIELDIPATIDDRKFIRDRIVDEYMKAYEADKPQFAH